MTTPPKALRSQEIRICGHRLSIRTDLDEQTLGRIVSFAEERLITQGLYNASEEIKRILLPFLVLCGEFIEQKEKLHLLEKKVQNREEQAVLLAEKLEVAFGQEITDIDNG